MERNIRDQKQNKTKLSKVLADLARVFSANGAAAKKAAETPPDDEFGDKRWRRVGDADLAAAERGIPGRRENREPQVRNSVKCYVSMGSRSPIDELERRLKMRVKYAKRLWSAKPISSL
jgi:hypothetical protein